MTATQLTYRDAMLNKESSKIFLLKSAQGTLLSDDFADASFLFGQYFLKLEKEKCRIATHLEALEFDVSLVATEWFLCLFSKSLPSEVRTVLSLSLSLPNICYSSKAVE